MSQTATCSVTSAVGSGGRTHDGEENDHRGTDGLGARACHVRLLADLRTAPGCRPGGGVVITGRQQYGSVLVTEDEQKVIAPSYRYAGKQHGRWKVIRTYAAYCLECNENLTGEPLMATRTWAKLHRCSAPEEG